MAIISGFGGTITFTGGTVDFDGEVFEWSLNRSHNAIKIPPAFGESQTVTRLGAGEFTGSLTGKVDNAVTNAPYLYNADADPETDLLTALVLGMTSATSYSFNAVLFNISLTRPHDGFMGLTADFANSDSVMTIDVTP